MKDDKEKRRREGASLYGSEIMHGERKTWRKLQINE